MTLAFLVTAFCSRTSAQHMDAFPEDDVGFLRELAALFEKVAVKENRDLGAAAMSEFSIHWNNGDFTEEIKTNIHGICDQMLSRRMKAFPHFYHYLACMNLMMTTNQPLNSYRAWHKGVDQLVKDRRSSNPMTVFLEISHGLLGNSSLYQSKATLWKSRNREFYFEYDTVPYVIFDHTTLTCYAHHDSTVIYETRGSYYPLSTAWYGEGGRINWIRAGFSPADVYAELNTYEINLRFSRFTVESVSFYHKQYWNQPLLGSLEEKVLANVNEENATYPKFKSYYTHLKIDPLFEDISFEGGIEMNGAKMLGLGDEENDARVTIKKDGKEFISVRSKNFVIRKNRISSSMASVTLRFAEDSIYHPGLEVNYVDENRELSFIRTGKGLSQSPFFNSFHSVDMYCEAIYWKMDEPNIHFETIKGITGLGRATLESANFFSAARFHKLQGIDPINPLMLIKNYSDMTGLQEISVDGLKDYMKKPREQVIALLVDLTNRGFLLYDTDLQKAKLKRKLFDYISAFNKKIDYDAIQFNSETYGYQNASLELDSFGLKLYGVPIVFLSDSQNVFLYPENEQLVMHRNRDFVFSGRVHAGLFDFYASDCAFDYNQFKLDMPKIDSISFVVPSFEIDEYGKRKLVKVKNVIAELSGELLIDDPNNKSGLRDFPQYPIFTSTRDGYVYYDKPTIHNGVYTRDHFYFYVYPFSIDSLDNFRTDVLGFSGYLASAGIFPDIEENLKVQPDYSLGFITTTPGAGYPAYNGKGAYFSKISLSNRGLRGNGSLEYLTSTSWSNDFLFFPDSCRATAQNFMIREQVSPVEYPSVKGIEVREHWMPYENRMIIRQTEFPLAMFDNQTQLYGMLVLTPTELRGGGQMSFQDALLNARLFSFKHHEFFSDTADFTLKTPDKMKVAFSTHNYRSHIDLQKRKGEFVSNGGVSVADFPVNQYICLIDEFGWYMDSYEIAMGSEETAAEMAALDNLTLRELVDAELKGSEFISVHPDQDSLRFIATTATFSLKDNIIHAEDVKYIRVADAAIFPRDKRVDIGENAQIKSFIGCDILTNTVTKYHHIYDATTDIFSRKRYWAIGNYDYIDETGYKQKVQFSKIDVDSTYQTIGRGHVFDSLGFTLSNDFDFAGDVRLFASQEFLTFDGGFRIRHTCSPGKRSWVKFNSEIDPKDIMIAIGDSLTDTDLKSLEASLLFSEESSRFYTGFFAPKRNPVDQSVLRADGFLKFDKIAEDYVIASREKLKRTSMAGNQLALDRRHCILRGEGEMNLGVDLGMVRMFANGSVEHFIIPDSTRFQMVLGLDFPFEEKALELLVEDIVGKNLPAVDVTKPVFLKALTDIMGEREAEKLITDINLFGRLRRYPNELIHSLFFADIKMKWNYATRSYVSVGPIGIGSIGKQQVSKYVDGFIEIEKKRTGDEISIYFEFEKGRYWYFFNYRNNLMQTISSNEVYNSVIRDLKDDKRTVKGEKGAEDYRFIISNLRKKTDFLRKMK